MFVARAALSALHAQNPQLAACLKTHLIPPDLVSDPGWNGMFKIFLDERARQMFALIERYTSAPAE